MTMKKSTFVRNTMKVPLSLSLALSTGLLILFSVKLKRWALKRNAKAINAAWMDRGYVRNVTRLNPKTTSASAEIEEQQTAKAALLRTKKNAEEKARRQWWKEQLKISAQIDAANWKAYEAKIGIDKKLKD